MPGDCAFARRALREPVGPDPLGIADHWEFDFRSRVDFVRIPGIIKLRNGQYTPLKLHIDTDDTLALRESIIEHTAQAFDPDLFIVDKEPLGLRGEVRSTLRCCDSGAHQPCWVFAMSWTVPVCWGRNGAQTGDARA